MPFAIDADSFRFSCIAIAPLTWSPVCRNWHAGATSSSAKETVLNKNMKRQSAMAAGFQLAASSHLPSLQVSNTSSLQHLTFFLGWLWFFFFFQQPLTISNQVVVQLGYHNQILCGRWKATSVMKNRFWHQLQLVCNTLLKFNMEPENGTLE